MLPEERWRGGPVNQDMAVPSTQQPSHARSNYWSNAPIAPAPWPSPAGILFLSSLLIRTVFAISGCAFTKAGPKDQFSNLITCRSNTGLMVSSSASDVESKQSVGSYGQLTDSVDV